MLQAADSREILETELVKEFSRSHIDRKSNLYYSFHITPTHVSEVIVFYGNHEKRKENEKNGYRHLTKIRRPVMRSLSILKQENGKSPVYVTLHKQGTNEYNFSIAFQEIPLEKQNSLFEDWLKTL